MTQDRPAINPFAAPAGPATASAGVPSQGAGASRGKGQGPAARISPDRSWRSDSADPTGTAGGAGGVEPPSSGARRESRRLIIRAADGTFDIPRMRVPHTFSNAASEGSSGVPSLESSDAGTPAGSDADTVPGSRRARRAWRFSTKARIST